MRCFPYVKFALIMVIALLMLGATLEFAAGRLGMYYLPGRAVWLTPNIRFVLYPFLQRKEPFVLTYTTERTWNLTPIDNRMLRKSTRIFWFEFSEFKD
jgi:hypothetical protein